MKAEVAQSGLTNRQIRQLLQDYVNGDLNAAIAKRFDLTARDVINIARYHNVCRRDQDSYRRAVKATEKIAIGTHLTTYKRTRRGFHIPRAREPEFIALLLKGHSRIDAARKMGVL